MESFTLSDYLATHTQKNVGKTSEYRVCFKGKPCPFPFLPLQFLKPSPPRAPTSTSTQRRRAQHAGIVSPSSVCLLIYIISFNPHNFLEHWSARTQECREIVSFAQSHRLTTVTVSKYSFLSPKPRLFCLEALSKESIPSDLSDHHPFMSVCSQDTANSLRGIVCLLWWHLVTTFLWMNEWKDVRIHPCT